VHSQQGVQKACAVLVGFFIRLNVFWSLCWFVLPVRGELATELHFFKEYALSVLHILCISWHIMQFEFYFVNSTSQPEVDQSCFQDVTVSK